MKIVVKNSPNHYAGRRGWKADMIVMHQSGGNRLAPALNYYLNGNVCSPNWLIDTDGTIYQCVHPDNAAWCNGTRTTPGDKLYYGYALSKIVRDRQTNANYYTYSIEFVHCQWGNINEAQITAAVELIQQIIIPHMRKNGVTPKIDREHIIGHSEITPKTRDPETYNCPGKKFPFDEIIARVLGKQTEKTVADSAPAAAVSVGDKVTIKSSAATYAGVTTIIPAGFKGSKRVYTVSKVAGEKALLKELYSWVWMKDLMKK